MTILINPDIHGRHFWEQSREYIDEVDKVVFLGDYFDPYPYEYDPYKLSKNDKNVLGDAINVDDDMIKNFKNIIKFKKSYPDKVVLLLGNHDVQYISAAYRKYCKLSRYSHKYSDIIVRSFNKNRGLLQYAYSIHCMDKNDKEYTLLFSHAGISEGWYSIYSHGLNDLFSDCPVSKIADRLNNDDEWGPVFRAMCDVSWERNGYDNYGGPLWADFTEFMGSDYKDFTPLQDELFQIVGHTQLTKIPLILNTIICCDIRRPFIFDTVKKELYELNGTRCLTLKEFRAMCEDEKEGPGDNEK